jgi:hypothetical protein
MNNDDKWRRDKSPPQPVEGVTFLTPSKLPKKTQKEEIPHFVRNDRPRK